MIADRRSQIAIRSAIVCDHMETYVLVSGNVKYTRACRLKSKQHRGVLRKRRPKTRSLLRRPCKTENRGNYKFNTHKAAARLSDIIGHYTSCVPSHYYTFSLSLYLFYTASTTDLSYLLCFAMRANLVVKFLRVSSGKLTTHIILVQQAEFER